MRFSVWLWPYGRWGGFDGIGSAARRIEQLGFDGITVSDHTVCPTGKAAATLLPDWPDWAVTSAFLATITERLRIVACVVVPYRHPVPVAKQIATLDQLSGGRLTVAACAGWWKHEFAILGVPYDRRGALVEEYIDAMRVLWTDERPSFSGRHVSFSDVIFEPKCRQRPHVPIWIAGGSGPKSLERVARVGDGWMPMGNEEPEVLRETIARVKEETAARGRDPARMTFRYTIGIGEAEPALGALSSAIADARGGIVCADPAATAKVEPDAKRAAESIRRYADAGITELAINPAGSSHAACMARIEWFAAEVMPIVR